MAQQEVTGKTEGGLEDLRDEFVGQRLHTKFGLSFETVYCLTPIGNQPEEYEGPQRFCSKRVGKYDDREDEYAPESYKPCCRFHGGSCTYEGSTEHLPEPSQAAITHGVYADDDHLQMDFSDNEQRLYDAIMDEWPDIYNWPTEDEDPARYLMLDMVATNVVRSNRAEDYIDEEGEVRISDKYNDEGIVVEPDGEHEENPIAREYRLLIREIKDSLKELGLTPRERQKMDTLESKQDANEAFSDIAASALDSDQEYDPGRFEDDG